MKTIIFTLSFILASSLLANPKKGPLFLKGKKQQSTVRVVSQLSQSLISFSQISKKISTKLKQKHAFKEASNYVQIFHKSKSLANQLQYTVLNKIQKKDLKKALKKWINLQPQFKKLSSSTLSLKNKPQVFHQKFKQVQRLRQLSGITIRTGAARSQRGFK